MAHSQSQIASTPFSTFKIWELLPRSARVGMTWSAIFASFYFFSVNVQPGRRAMKLLLYYRGWLYKDSGERGGLKTSSNMQIRKKFYLGSLWVLTQMVSWEKPLLRRRQRLYSFQDTLPALPVPKLRDTCERFLASVRPLLGTVEYERTAALVAEMASAGGEWENVQKILVQKAQDEVKESAWDEEWWEKNELLARRHPLPVNGNWYGLDRPDTPCASQAERAAWLVSGALRFYRHVRREYLEPLRMMDVVPLCMWQYRRIFHTCRIPGEKVDELMTLPPSGKGAQHLAVVCGGEFFTFPVCNHSGRMLTVPELQQLIEGVLDCTRKTKNGCKEPPVGILTSEERSTWASMRKQLQATDPGNAASLKAIETALFLLVLEGPSPKSMTDQAAVTFVGDGLNRWFDKSFQLLVFEDGVAGVNVEGSWADAPVLSHLFGFLHDHENMANFSDHPLLLAPSASCQALRSTPAKLTWKMTSELARGIDEAQTKFAKLKQQTDVHVTQMAYFGKGFIKKCSMSPDAFVQMALMLAYYRLYGCMPFTLESAHTRQFFHGRTEFVRSVSSDSVAFVKAMAHLDHASAETKLHLLRRACVTHVEKVKEAMNGRGIDKHLFGLRMVAKKHGMESSIQSLSSDAFKIKVDLWTAQAPTQRGPSGGFGTTEPGSYAICDPQHQPCGSHFSSPLHIYVQDAALPIASLSSA